MKRPIFVCFLCTSFYIFCMLAMNTGQVVQSSDVTCCNSSDNKELSPSLCNSKSVQLNLPWSNLGELVHTIFEDLQNLIKRIFDAMRSLFVFQRHSSMLKRVPDGNQSELYGDAKGDSVLLQRKEISWSGKPATELESKQVVELQQMLRAYTEKKSQWLLEGPYSVELLRFLRSRNGNVGQAYKALLQHDKWRVSSHGAESEFVQKAYKHSPLAREIFWLGLNKEGCPTLVVRTQLHDGVYYNDDPRIYTGRIVALLEEGRRLYGVGLERQMCVLIDRAGTVFKNGKKKVDKLDMGVLPGLIELFRHMYSTLMDNYPDLLQCAAIAPASWFFSMCYKVTSRVMNPAQREKFAMVKEQELGKKVHSILDTAKLPTHLGGQNPSSYSSLVDIDFQPEQSYFPIDSKKLSKYFKQINGEKSVV